MIDFSKNNFFLSTIYDLYEATYMEENIMCVEEEKKFIIFKKKKNKTKKDIVYEKGLDKVDYIKSNIPSFNNIFDFCTFIRSMEKVFFFKNDTHSLVSSDSDISNMKIRNLHINTEKYRISMYLSRLDNFTTESIEIDIYRKYGKKLVNKFKIKNKDVVYNDCDDLMLINVINMLLQNIMSDIFKKYLDAIYNKEILNTETYDFVNILK